MLYLCYTYADKYILPHSTGHYIQCIIMMTFFIGYIKNKICTEGGLKMSVIYKLAHCVQKVNDPAMGDFEEKNINRHI